MSRISVENNRCIGDSQNPLGKPIQFDWDISENHPSYG